MKKNIQALGKYEDETGEEFYCPISAVKNSRIDNDWALDNCVEATTAGRYSGNLEVVDRFTS